MNWQELINDVYAYWNSDDNITYGDILKYANKKFGNVGELAILVKNYNYQVCNGGHLQYFDNGYCEENVGIFSDKDESIPLHHRMIQLIEILNIHHCNAVKPIYEVMCNFNVEICEAYEEEVEYICENCGGAGYIYTDEFEETEEKCCECDGDGYIDDVEYYDEDIYINNEDKLNKEYYKHNDVFIAYFEKYVIEHTKEM